jgi:uroporphyrinogen decarboxylase
LLFHTCGSVFVILEDLIEIGIDALNPIQVSAAQMEPGRIKAAVGDRLALWGGIDTQHLLPYGHPAAIQCEVCRTIELMGNLGGYVLAAVHNIQPQVPPENIIALFTAPRAFERSKPQSEPERKEA